MQVSCPSYSRPKWQLPRSRRIVTHKCEFAKSKTLSDGTTATSGDRSKIILKGLLRNLRDFLSSRQGAIAKAEKLSQVGKWSEPSFAVTRGPNPNYLDNKECFAPLTSNLTPDRLQTDPRHILNRPQTNARLDPEWLQTNPLDRFDIFSRRFTRDCHKQTLESLYFILD